MGTASRFAFSVLALTLLSCARQKPRTDLDSIGLLRGDIALCGGERLGEVNFLNTCLPEAQGDFNLAVALLHSFEYEEAEKAFVKVIDRDPSCVMAYWGVAMSNLHALWIQSGTDYLEKGSKILEATNELPKSERETDYLESIGSFYRDWQAIPHRERLHRFEQKMEALSNKYPNDLEAAIFYALALDAAADPSDTTYANQRKAGQLLEKILKEKPNHPGIAHYIIHNYDYPELAFMALPTARRYAQIAPSSAHAQHMPSHIFTQLGLWQESIQSNLQSTAAAVCYGQSLDSEGHWDEELHGMDYLVYAYLQTGQNQKAIEQLNYLLSFKKVFPVNFKVAYSAAAIPSRIALENKQWDAASKLELPSVGIDWNLFPWQSSLVHYARALGFIHRSDVSKSKLELASLRERYDALMARKEPYLALHVKIQAMIVEGWIEFLSGNKKAGLDLLREATTLENKTPKHPVTPGPLVPAGEQLADMLALDGKSSEALHAYESDLKHHANRLNELFNVATLSERLGDHETSRRYFQQLLSLKIDPSSNRTEFDVAEKFLKGSGAAGGK